MVRGQGVRGSGLFLLFVAMATAMVGLSTRGFSQASAQSLAENSNFMQSIFMGGQGMIERHIDQAVFVGHHAKAFLPNYTASDYYVRDWEPLLIPKSYASDSSSSPSSPASTARQYLSAGKVVRAHDEDFVSSSKADDVLLVRRHRPTRLAKDNCHVLFFHGNAQNLAMTLDTLDSMEENLGCHMYAIEYSGYRSDPAAASIEPSEEALTEDALAATNWLLDVTRRGDDEVFLYGHSLGAALAIDVAAKMNANDQQQKQLERKRGKNNHVERYQQHQQQDPELAGIILESPFLSAIRTRMDYERNEAFGETLSESSIPSLSRNFLKPLDKFKNEEKIELIGPDLPIFIGHATNDKVVPFEHGQKLFDLIDGERKVGLFLESDSHALHNETEAASVPFYAALNNFLKKTLEERESTPRVHAKDDRRLNSPRETFSWESDQRNRGREEGRLRVGRGKSQWDDFLLGLTAADSTGRGAFPPSRHDPLKKKSNNNMKLNRKEGRANNEDTSFGLISVRKAPEVRYDAQANTKTTSIIVDLTAEMRARGHQILTLQSSKTKMLPQVTNAARRYAPQVWDLDREETELVNHYKGCTFNTQIGPSVTALGTFDLDENAKAVITLPAKICDADSPRSGLFQTVESTWSSYTQCQEFTYQFLDQATCRVSNPLHAADAL
jgi:fermentation-respiration switch protein FrsA (DUF1100 family)